MSCLDFSYSSKPRLFRAPGRVNLIGEHTDYNQGFVMPAAIDLATIASIAPEETREITVHSSTFAETFAFDMEEQNPVPRQAWSDYIQGIAVMLERAGYRLKGAHLCIDSTIPIGSGLSSSAALEIAAALALLTNSGRSLELTELALLCQRAENEFVGARCGIMDQFACCYGRAGHAILLDCRSLQMNYVPLPAGIKLVVCNTMVRHELAANEYNLRRTQCEQGIQVLSKILPHVHSLRDVTVADLVPCAHSLDPVIYRRCRHVVTENQRVLEAGAALHRGDLKSFGELMAASHASLRDDYEVSCPELDLMVRLALETDGIHGARMTGGGFGGCTVNLVDASQAERFSKAVASAYDNATGRHCAIYICSAENGAAEERSKPQ